MDYPYRKLTAGTVSCYRTRLRKLRRVYPLMEEGEEKRKTYREMEKLADKLGMEIEDPMLDRGPGRPRERVPEELINVLDQKLKAEPKPPGARETDPEVRKWIPGTVEFAEREARVGARVGGQPLTTDQERAHVEALGQEELIRRANDALAEKLAEDEKVVKPDTDERNTTGT
jgi:hypothetical protein